MKINFIDKGVGRAIQDEKNKLTFSKYGKDDIGRTLVKYTNTAGSETILNVSSLGVFSKIMKTKELPKNIYNVDQVRSAVTDKDGNLIGVIARMRDDVIFKEIK